MLPQTPISNFDVHYHHANHHNYYNYTNYTNNNHCDMSSVPYSPVSPFDSRKYPLCQALGRIFNYESAITPEYLFPLFLEKAHDLVQGLCYQDFGNNSSKQQAAATLCKYQRDDFQGIDENIFESEIIPSLYELLEIHAFDIFSRGGTTCAEYNNFMTSTAGGMDSNDMASSMTMIYNIHPMPETIQQYVSSEPSDADLQHYSSSDDEIILSPPRHERGSIVVPFDVNDMDVLTRIFYHIIRTSRKLFIYLNIPTKSGKSSKFQDLDFTNLSLTLNHHPALRKGAALYLKKLKAIRNEWAHFNHKDAKISSDQMDKAFDYTQRIYKEYLTVSQTTKNKKGIEYAQKRIVSLLKLQKTYKDLKQKKKLTSKIVNMFYRNAEQGDLHSNASSSLVQVLKQIIQKIEQNPSSPEAKSIMNTFLLDYIPQSPKLFEQIKELRAHVLSQQQIEYEELDNKYQLLLEETNTAVKGLNASFLLDPRFIDTKSFFESVVIELQQAKDQRSVTFLNAFCLYLVKKALKQLREENVQISDSAIQEFLEKRSILNDERSFTMIMEGEIKPQCKRFRNFWMVLANGMYLCCNNNLQTAILNFAWCQSHLSDPTFLNYPRMKEPFEEIIRIFIEKCTFWLSFEINTTPNMTIHAVRVLIHSCLVCCQKYSNFNMSESYSMVVNTLSRVLKMQEIVSQLNDWDRSVLDALYFRNSSLDMSRVLQQDINVSSLDKKSRISIAEEARLCFQEAWDRLFA